jgi:hypothetical protein
MIAAASVRGAAGRLRPGLFDTGDPTLARRVDEELADGFSA